MKVIVRDNERGFLFQNGIFKQMLLTGKHTVYRFLNQTVEIVKAEGIFKLKDYDPSIFMRDKHFVESIVKTDVPDGNFAIHYEDGKIKSTLASGTYYFWNIFKKQTFQQIDLANSEITEVNESQLICLPMKYYNRYEVPNGFVGLLFYNRKFEKLLNSGTYCFWNGSVKTSLEIVDMRLKQMDIASQEILTADKVSLRINFTCRYKITDAVKVMTEITDHYTQIYNKVQLVLRELIGTYKFDELLEEKDKIAGFVLEKLKISQNEFYVDFMDAGIKDIILPGEIRDIMNTVLAAEKRAQANVITRREEVASTRSLLNTAKLMEENTVLYKLKELEYIEKICDKVGNISVGNESIITSLSNILS